MKILITLGILVNVLFAIPQCDQNQDLCAYIYKSPLGIEIKVINMRHKTIIFSIGGEIGNTRRIVYNRKLEPYQTYSLIKKRYKYGEKHDKAYYSFSGENYIPSEKQDLKLSYPYNRH